MPYILQLTFIYNLFMSFDVFKFRNKLHIIVITLLLLFSALYNADGREYDVKRGNCGLNMLTHKTRTVLIVLALGLVIRRDGKTLAFLQNICPIREVFFEKLKATCSFCISPVLSLRNKFNNREPKYSFFMKTFSCPGMKS